MSHNEFTISEPIEPQKVSPISDDVEAVYHRLGIEPQPIKSTQGQNYLHWLETHFNIQ